MHYFRFAKAEIWSREQEKQAADLARRRFEFREQRLDEAKRARAERLAKKKAALSQISAGDAGAEAVIKASVERVRARKSAVHSQAVNVDGATSEDPTGENKANHKLAQESITSADQ